MADQKISQLTPLTGANVDDDNDTFIIVDASNQDNKSITRAELFQRVAFARIETQLHVRGRMWVDGGAIFFNSGFEAGDHLAYATQVGLTYHENGTPVLRLGATNSTPNYFIHPMAVGHDTPLAKFHAKVEGAASDAVVGIFESFRPNILLKDASTDADSVQLFADSGTLEVRTGPFVNATTKLVDLRMKITGEGRVAFGGEDTPEATVHIRTAGNWTPNAAKSVSPALFLESNNATPGNGSVGPALLFSKVNSSRPGAAIASMQTDNDGDRIGLGFYVHPSASSTDALELAGVLNAQGYLALGRGLTTPIRPLHVYSSTTSSCRLRLENSEGWADAIADGGGLFRISANSTGGADRSYFTYDGRGAVSFTGEPTYNGTGLYVGNNNASYTGRMVLLQTTKSGANDFDFLRTRSNSGNDSEHVLRGDGQAYADGSWNTGGAEYAEYVELVDAYIGQDLRGVSMTLEGGKMRPAVAGEPIIGVVSRNASVIGNSDIGRWRNKYLRTEYGDYDLDENGLRVLNPEWDESLEYVSREERPEWELLGMLGQIVIRKGQPTDPRWIKMKDLSDTTELWLVR